MSMHKVHCVTAAASDSNAHCNDSVSFLQTTWGFKMASINITSLLKHLDELGILLADNSVDVLAINETRLDSSISDCELFIPGYEIFRRDRSINGRHGESVCFYVRSTINYTPRLDLNIDHLENLCIEIRKPRAKPFLVITWYWPPDSTVDKFSCFELDVGGLEYYLMGDMNVNLAAPHSDNNSRLLTSITDLYGLHQLRPALIFLTDWSAPVSLISASAIIVLFMHFANSQSAYLLRDILSYLIENLKILIQPTFVATFVYRIGTL